MCLFDVEWSVDIAMINLCIFTARSSHLLMKNVFRSRNILHLMLADMINLLRHSHSERGIRHGGGNIVLGLLIIIMLMCWMLRTDIWEDNKEVEFEDIKGVENGRWNSELFKKHLYFPFLQPCEFRDLSETTSVDRSGCTFEKLKKKRSIHVKIFKLLRTINRRYKHDD